MLVGKRNQRNQTDFRWRTVPSLPNLLHGPQKTSSAERLYQIFLSRLSASGRNDRILSACPSSILNAIVAATIVPLDNWRGDGGDANNDEEERPLRVLRPQNPTQSDNPAKHTFGCANCGRCPPR